MSHRRAVITGIGPITCIGQGCENFWNAILAEKSGINDIASFDPSAFRVRSAGEIRDWDPEVFFSPHRLKRLDRYGQFAVVSAQLALDDAHIEYSREKPQDRIGVSFGTALGGVCKAEEQYLRYLKKGARGVQPTLAVQVFGGSAHSNIAIEFGFRGVGTTNSNSCASGTVSVGEALRYIRDDFADVIVAGGAEAPLTAITIGAFDIIKTMSRWTGDPALACRPFDLLRDGFVMGEGGASLVVEELEHARARGARIYAEVLGYAQLAPEQIDYVNAHASSTQLNDSTETASIKQVLGEQAQRIAVSGTKGYYAHPLGATGTIEAALCALALDRQWIPPTINYGIPDPACDLDIVPNSGRAAELNYVMSNSFGFGGINACIVIGKIRD